MSGPLIVAELRMKWRDESLSRCRVITEQINAAQAEVERLAALRRAAVLSAVESGVHYAEIATHLGVSKARVGQIVQDREA